MEKNNNKKLQQIFLNKKLITTNAEFITELLIDKVSHIDNNCDAWNTFVSLIDSYIPTKTIEEKSEENPDKINKRTQPLYELTSRQYEKFKEYFDTMYEQSKFNFLLKNHYKQFDYKDTEKFDKLNSYLWNNLFLTTDTNSTIREFKHWMINLKKQMKQDSNLNPEYETIFGLYDTVGGSGKSFIMRALAKAVTVGNKLINFTSSLFSGFNSHYLKDCVGVLYKDEINDLSLYKDNIKEMITATQVEVREKYKPSYFIPKTFAMLITSNKTPGAYLFSDESNNQRRNAVATSLGRLKNCDEKDLIEYFKLMFKYCPVTEDINDYLSNTVTKNTYTKEYYDMVDAIKSLHYFANKKSKNGPTQAEIKKELIARGFFNAETKDDMYRQLHLLKQILENPQFFRTYKIGNCSTKRYISTDRFMSFKNTDTTITYSNTRDIDFTNLPYITFDKMIEEALGPNNGPKPTKIIEDINELDNISAEDISEDIPTETESKEINLSFATITGTMVKNPEMKKGNLTVKQLSEYLNVISEKTDKKDDAQLISNGYNSFEDLYPRSESSFDRVDSILIDCDNPNNDKTILDNFKNETALNEKIIYETASSNEDKPKFRAIIPLDKPIVFDNKLKMSHIKKAIAKIFKDYTDPKASWFYTPIKSKKDTIKYYPGKPFNSEIILNYANKIYELECDMNNLYTKQAEYRKGDNTSWRNLPSVKYCFAGLTVGERDSSINTACYAILKNGYSRNDIHDFLSELICQYPDLKEFVSKFKNRNY